jgi:hypothetical protein
MNERVRWRHKPDVFTEIHTRRTSKGSPYRWPPAIKQYLRQLTGASGVYVTTNRFFTARLVATPAGNYSYFHAESTQRFETTALRTFMELRKNSRRCLTLLLLCGKTQSSWDCIASSITANEEPMDKSGC